MRTVKFLAFAVCFMVFGATLQAAETPGHEMDKDYPKMEGKKVVIKGKIAAAITGGKIKRVYYKIYKSLSPAGSELKPDQQVYPTDPDESVNATVGDANGPTRPVSGTTADDYKKGDVLKIEVIVVLDDGSGGEIEVCAGTSYFTVP